MAIVIAEPTGKLYHAIFVESAPNELENVSSFKYFVRFIRMRPIDLFVQFIYLQSFNEVDSTIRLHPAEWVVNVLEIVELELGLPDVSGKKSNDCPIFLRADTNNDSRYFAYHNTGLHAISIEFIPDLERYFESDGNNISSNF